MALTCKLTNKTACFYHQGKKCMTLIDTDRLTLATEQGYMVSLGTMSPPSCSPKNNLLTGRSPTRRDYAEHSLEDTRRLLTDLTFYGRHSTDDIRTETKSMDSHEYNK